MLKQTKAEAPLVLLHYLIMATGKRVKHSRAMGLFYRRNILPKMNSTYLRSCDRGNDSLCPIFRLGDVVRQAGENFSEMAIEVGSCVFFLPLVTLKKEMKKLHWLLQCIKYTNILIFLLFWMLFMLAFVFLFLLLLWSSCDFICEKYFIYNLL